MHRSHCECSDTKVSVHLVRRRDVELAAYPVIYPCDVDVAITLLEALLEDTTQATNDGSPLLR
jgi:hypothetical protein